jgi:predicted Zn-dependent protease
MPRSFEQATRPGLHGGGVSLAQMDFMERDLAGARKRYEQVLAKEPGNEQALLSMAALLTATKAPEAEIKAVIARAIAANPTSIRPHMFLIAYYVQQKDAKAALAAAQAAQAVFPENPQIVELLGAAQRPGERIRRWSFTRAAKCSHRVRAL